MNDQKQTLPDYRLTTAEIIYHLPDHPDLLQSFIWQKLDVAPDYPELRRFLEFWSRNIEGKLHSVRVGQARHAGRPRFRHITTRTRLN
ncbi:MAG: Usg family protein [Alphaproteobacteria bacterium]|nr:Usg family protein [Alphaproteobacteria bacterium]